MNVIVTANGLRGELEAIPSKSHAHRLLIAAALCEKRTSVHCQSVSSDVVSTIESLQALCAKITTTSKGFPVTPRPATDGAVLPCGESGSTYRFLLPVACALGVSASFSLNGRLPQRPMDALFGQLTEHGISIRGEGTGQPSVSGKLRGGKFRLPGDVSSQFISGLCFALPLLEEGGEIEIEGELESKGYVEMTRKTLEAFGVRTEFDGRVLKIPGGQRYLSPHKVKIEGDWSNSAYWLCAGAGCGDVRVTGLDPDSTQGDRAITEILARMGANIAFEEGAVRSAGGEMHGIEIDMRNIPDLAPALCVAALAAKGETALLNAKRLRLKESDRIASITQALSAIGADVEAREDSIVIRGGKRLRGGTASAQGDHRIAMMLGCAAALCEGPVMIGNAETVAKSYTAFYMDLISLGADVRMAELQPRVRTKYNAERV